MNKFFINRKESIAITLAGMASVLLVSGIVYSSTIGTDVSTGGALTVSGASTLSGAATLSSTLGVTGLSTLTGGYVSQASSTVVGNFRAANLTTAGTASSTSLLVGSEPNNTVSGIMFGFCTIANISVVVASSTVQTTCAGATDMTTSYRVFVQATSSMPRQIVIQSATSSAGAVEVRLLNPTGGIGTPAAAPVSLNYWAIK